MNSDIRLSVGFLPVFVAFAVLLNDMSHTSKQYYIIQ